MYSAAPIRRAVGFEDLVEPVAEIFGKFSQGHGGAPMTVFAPAGADGDVHVKSAWMPGRAIFTVKVATWFAARATDRCSAGSGFVAAHDATTGDLLAVLQDEHHLTDVRTAAAGAVANRLLARADARTLAVLGTGPQSYLQALAACSVRPIDTVLIWGRRAAAAAALRRAVATRLPDLDVTVVDDAEAAVVQADVIVTATSSRVPVLHGSWLRPGQHITSVGADDPTKAELDPASFIRADLVVVDSRADTPRLAGDLHRAVAAGSVAAVDLVEIGELVLGAARGRRADSEITVAKLVGLGSQDLVAAEIALSRLLQGSAVPSREPASGRDLLHAVDPIDEPAP